MALLFLPAKVATAIAQERQRQNEKWGEQNHVDEIWLAILSEELGEVSQALLHNKFGGDHAGTLRQELVQVAAVAVQWLECIDRGGKRIAGFVTEAISLCEWSLDDLEGGYWKPSCTVDIWILEAGDPKENGMNFCPFCGRELKQLPAPSSDDEDEDNGD